MRSVRPLRSTTSDSRWAGYSMTVILGSDNQVLLRGDLADEHGELLVREVVPAAAGVVLALLDVAGERHLADLLAGDLPAIGELLELLARGGGVLLGNPVVGAAELAAAVGRAAGPAT